MVNPVYLAIFSSGSPSAFIRRAMSMDCFFSLLQCLFFCGVHAVGDVPKVFGVGVWIDVLFHGE